MKKLSRAAAIASAVVLLAASVFPSSVIAADDFGGMDWSQMGGMDMGNMDWSQFGGGDMGGMDWSQMGGMDMGGMDWSQMGGMDMGNMDWSQFGGGDMGGMDMGNMDWSQFGGGDMGNMDWSQFGGGDMGNMDWSQFGGGDMGGMDWSQFGGGDMGGMDWSQFGGGDMGNMDWGQMGNQGGNTDWSGFSGGNGDNPDIADAVFDNTTKVSLYGDVDKDGTISANDCTALRKYLLGITAEKNGEMDVNKDGNVSIVDYITLISAILGETEIEQPQQQQQDEGGATTSPADFLAKFKSTLTNNVPSSATQKNSYYKMEKITYFSKAANKNKPANVLLPDDYNTNEKYPVFVCTHGIMGNQDSMIGSDMKVVDMAGNLMHSGEAKKMIIVFPDMFTSKTMSGPSGIDQATCAAYDNFVEDVTESLLPFIYEHYSAKQGRDFTAISGFSMGGREALYCGIKRPDVFGYVGAACPAPGITKSRDMFMEHPGTMSESQVKIDPAPYLLFITGGTNDQVVGTFPSEYSNMFKQNGQDHAYQTIQGGGHGAECVTPHMYNFLKAIFQA